MKAIVVHAFAALFVFCVVYAMLHEYSRMRIPNRVSVVLALGFFPFARLAGSRSMPMLQHIGLAALVVAALFACFAMGWMGGGDVKLASAIMLWVGPGQGADFVML